MKGVGATQACESCLYQEGARRSMGQLGLSAGGNIVLYITWLGHCAAFKL